MVHKQKESKGEAPRLDMTPMIDVVFQLLIFFVVVMKQDDILSKFSAARPGITPPPRGPVEITPTTITVGTQGFVLNDRAMSLSELDTQLKRIAVFSKTAGVLVKCVKDSPHGLLVQALDLCGKHGMENIAIVTI